MTIHGASSGSSRDVPCSQAPSHHGRRDPGRVRFPERLRPCRRSRNSPAPIPSGAPAIFLDQAARMGARTEMFGGVGDDGFGRARLRRLKEDGVDTVRIACRAGPEHRHCLRVLLRGWSSRLSSSISGEHGCRRFRPRRARNAARPARTVLHVSAASLWGDAVARRSSVQAVGAPFWRGAGSDLLRSTAMRGPN